MNATAPLEALYRRINATRRSLYRRGVLDSETLPRPVISIGNRAIGGSGKTPLTIAIARGLVRRGIGVAVLTRGYGRRSAEQPLLVEGEDAARFGDEPVVIARNVPEAAVVVGSRRAAAGRWLLEQRDVDVFLLDDGFQHLQLARDLDLVIEAPHARWYREGEESLRDADVVFRRGVRTRESREIGIDVAPSEWLHGGASRPLEELKGKPVFAFSGLADNAQFFATVERLGARLAGSMEFRDHHVYRPADLERIRAMAVAKGAELILTTEKDAVKAKELGAAILRVAARIEREDELMELLVAKIAKPDVRQPL